MSMIKNDQGNWVVSEGAPGSIMRVQCEHPALIATINECYDYSCGEAKNNIDTAKMLIKQSGINSRLETESLLMVSKYARYMG